MCFQRVEEQCPSLPHACTCSQDSKGPPGPSGPPVRTDSLLKILSRIVFSIHYPLICVELFIDVSLSLSAFVFPSSLSYTVVYTYLFSSLLVSYSFWLSKPYLKSLYLLLKEERLYLLLKEVFKCALLLCFKQPL